FIVVSGKIGQDTAVAVMKSGANDYVMKDNLERLSPVIERELREAEVRKERIAELEKADTERKQAEEALRISEEHYRALVSNIPGAIYIGDADWTITFASPAFEEISGYLGSDYINNSKRTFASVVHPDDLKYLEDEISKAYKEKRNNIILEYRIIHQKGDIRWLSDRVTLLKGEDGEEKSFEGIVFDITERKQVDEALQESEDKFRTIFENVNDEIVYLDEAGT
ncbi:MAG: PAS domain S-box protein, partial [Planctomycetes bacterium]|nr:PAS domain S-box protein [Planctomycetota bacterium]